MPPWDDEHVLVADRKLIGKRDCGPGSAHVRFSGSRTERTAGHIGSISVSRSTM
jgi:hypothetical protein